MKRININRLIEGNGLTLERRLLGMEFIRQNDGNYIIKGSNNIIVSEKEKKELERDELVIKDIESPCAKDITPKLTKKKKEIKKLDDIKETSTTLE